MGWFKSDKEVAAERRVDHLRSSSKASVDRIVAAQCKASNERNKRRAK